MLPTKDFEVKRFKIEHSQECRNLKVFTTTNIIFPSDPNEVDYEQLQALINNTDELKAWLINNHIQFETAEESV